MLKTVPDVLAQIVGHKRQELAVRRRDRDRLERQAMETTRRPFAKALAAAHIAIIAEIKKASPSKGVLSAAFSPESIARAYEQGGAAALSVLTDQRYFQGSLAHLQEARSAVAIPVLRKDFTIDEFDVVEAAASGADAVLLIAAILSELQLRVFREQAESFSMAALVEVHDRDDLDLALASGAAIVGVNNRDLHTFEVTLETSLRLAEHIPSGVVKVSESGIRSKSDIGSLRDAGYQAFLIGEHLMRSGDPRQALRDLVA